MSKTTVPAIPLPRAENLLDVAKAVKGILDVREGLIGDPLDQAVTYRDLLNAGLAKTNVAFNPIGSGQYSPIMPLIASPDGYDPTADFTAPIQPAGLTTASGFAAIYLSWTGAGYRNHAYTEVWRATSNAIGSAVLLGTTISNVYSDLIATANTTYYYWIRFVSEADVKGPFNATNGVSGMAGDDPAYVMGVLSDAYGTTSQAPFFQLDAPATINGVSIPAGTYIKSAFIADATITSAKINSLVATKITSGTLTAAISVNTGYIYGGVDPSYAPGGTSFGTGYFLGKSSGSHQFYVGSPDKYLLWNGANLQVKGTVYADTGLIGGAVIDLDGIRSYDYSSTSGWKLDKFGSAYLNTANIRGGVYGGDFTDNFWPYFSTRLATGFALNSGGLKIGDYWNGKFFQVTDAGNVYAPKFEIVNGNATFSGNLSGAIVFADNIVSRSATYFTQSSFSVLGDDSDHYSSVDFYMDRAGYVAIVANYLFSYSGSDCSWAIKLGVDSYGGTPNWNAAQSGSFYSSAGPNGGNLQTSQYLSSGWHTLYGYCYHSCGASSTNYHQVQALILRSYR